MKSSTIKYLKLAVSVIGIGVTLVANYIADKELDKKVSEAVSEALKNNSDK